MENQLSILSLRSQLFFRKASFEMFPRNRKHAAAIPSVEADLTDEDSDIVEPYIEDDYEPSSSPGRKRSKKRKIYCFNCNRQEFHILAYKGTLTHSFLMGMSFGLTRVFGPYRCTCCGRKRAMFSDFCSPAYHWRMLSERRLSRTGRRRKSRRR